MFLVCNLNAQSNDQGEGIQFHFAKENIKLSKAETFFNVLKLENNGDETLSGYLNIVRPESWTMIDDSVRHVLLEPGKKAYFPLRMSLPKNTIGGVSYLVQAEFVMGELYLQATSYISIEKESRWDMYISGSDLFLSDFRPVDNFNIRLENKGNTNELIKLLFDIGDLLKFKTSIEADSILFVELPAFKDTVLNFEVYKRNDLSYAESRTLLQNWKSTSIYIKASTSDYETYDGLRVTPLKSSVENDLPLRNSPLNIDMRLYNLLSSQNTKFSMRVHGKVLFPEKQQIQYSIGMNNLYFNPGLYKNFDLAQQLRYSLRYSDKSTEVLIGDRLGLGNLHTMTGRGVQASINLGEFRKVDFNLIQNPYGRNIGSFVGYETKIGRLMVNTGFTVESAALSGSDFYSIHAGGSVHFLKHHTLRFQTASTMSHYSANNYLMNDTTVFGLAYRLNYYYNTKRIKIRIDNTNTQYTFLKNSGINRINADFSYIYSPTSRILGKYYRTAYESLRYPYNFYFPVNRNTNDNVRLFYSHTNSNIIYQIGTQLNNIGRSFYNSRSFSKTRYQNTQPGVLGSLTFLLGNMRSITPSVSFNSLFFKYSSGENEAESYQINGKWSYTAGISYYDQAFRLNAYYSNGDASEIYKSAVVDEDPVIGQAFHIRPSYERYFKEDKIKLDINYNYSYFLPSQRENTISNLALTFFVGNGWNAHGSINIFTNSRVDEVSGIIKTRDMNLMLGFRKAFDVQQPGLKYYDMVLLGFNDLDGDGEKDEDEKPISNVLINFKRDPAKNEEEKTSFIVTKLLTDPNGQISYSGLPEGIYDMEITPLSSIDDLFFLDGRNQKLVVDSDEIHYLPLVESYKVRGKIIVDRDPNSNFGRINLEGVRITATSDNGMTYAVLTNSSGMYTLNLPKANSYTITVYNVFGERFTLQQSSYRVQFMENKTIQIDFKFSEIRRSIKFNNGNQYFDFKIDE